MSSQLLSAPSAPRPRRAGILLHPTSLPGSYGLGDLGPEAFAFVEALAAAGQRLWQMLPLCPTGFGDSPYQAVGVMAGNPLLVSVDRLVEEGLLRSDELADLPGSQEPDRIDYGRAGEWKRRLLRHVSEHFHARARPSLRADFETWCEAQAEWLHDFALFSALKAAAGGEPWWTWAPELALRDPAALARARRELGEEVRAAMLAQYLFDRQLEALHAFARANGISLVGDLPLYPAHDCAEVWSHRALFRLDAAGAPQAVAGVPPDYFNADGQRWGNPLYRWDEESSRCVDLFVRRTEALLRHLDEARIDHFRGIEAYWEVPASAPTARTGTWQTGPGAALLDALRNRLGAIPLIAENLGVITPAVETLRRRFRMPGMAILQFAFGTDPQAHTFRPHAYERDVVAYTGTHDNDTVLGWWTSAGGDSTRSPEDIHREKAFALAYLDTDGSEMNWVMIRALLASVASTAVTPMQDVLGLGSEARMNRPGTASGNWRWRMRSGAFTRPLIDRLLALTELYDRS